MKKICEGEVNDNLDVWPMAVWVRRMNHWSTTSEVLLFGVEIMVHHMSLHSLVFMCTSNDCLTLVVLRNMLHWNLSPLLQSLQHRLPFLVYTGFNFVYHWEPVRYLVNVL